MKEYTYTVIVMPSWSGNGFRAICPVIPKCSVRGKTKKESIEKMRTKLDRRLDRMIERGEPIRHVKCCRRPVLS